MMVTAIILLGVERKKIRNVAEFLVEQSEISEVFSVSGNYDLVAVIRVKTNDDLANLVTDKLADVEGIEHTETMLAFRTYSRHDLEGMFSVGQ